MYQVGIGIEIRKKKKKRKKRKNRGKMSELSSPERRSAEGGALEGDEDGRSEQMDERSEKELTEQPLDLEEDLFGGEEEEEEEEEEEDEGEGEGEGELMAEDQPEEESHKRSALEYDEDMHAKPVSTRQPHIVKRALPNLPFSKPSDGKVKKLYIQRSVIYADTDGDGVSICSTGIFASRIS
jgi:hypothetical protein